MWTKTIDLTKMLRDWQKEFLKNTKRFNILVLHRRAWKTVVALLLLLTRALQEKWDYWYISPTYRQSKKIAFRMMSKFCNQVWWVSINISDLSFNFSNWSVITLFWAENPDSLRGLDLKGVIFDEYAQQPANIYWEIVFPMINANKWWVTWIWTPKWKNSFYKLYERATKDERFYTSLLKYTDTNLLDDEQIADAREEMTEEEFEQEYNCSWNASMRWSVYWKELSKAFAEWRVKSGIYDSNLEVYTFWDLGISDAMTILFVQVLWQEVRIIDSYKNTWYWLDHYAEVIHKKGYKYKTHYFPHDIRNRELSTGMSRIDTAIRLLWKNCDIVPSNTIESGINAWRLIFKNIWIEESLEDFINDISLYQYEWDDTKWEFKKIPKHDWTSHYADAFRYLATIFEYLIRTPISQDKEEKEIDIIFDDDEEEEEYTLTPY